MKNRYSHKAIYVFLIIILGVIAFFLFAPLSKEKENVYLYIDEDDTPDSLFNKMREHCHNYGATAVMTLSRHFNNNNNIRTGRYTITPSMNAFMLFRNLRNGKQEPLNLVITEVRTRERLADIIAPNLMMSKEELMRYLNNNDSLAFLGTGIDTCTVIALFLPYTYEVYWNISPRKLLKKMQESHKVFWNDERKAKAKALGLTPIEVQTLASIVDEETNYLPEKPTVAGMYYNRLKTDMPLQADPTVKFAMQNFALKRIYNNMLLYPSPYNTYYTTGLPPGPIRIASVACIDAVLNLHHHDFFYMCAKDDLSGSHVFAVTYPEHLQNAAKYTAALNARGIK